MNKLECPTDSQLLALDAGDSSDSQLQAHIASCDWCRRRTEQLHSQLNEIADACNEMASHQTKIQLPTKKPGSDDDSVATDDD